MLGDGPSGFSQGFRTPEGAGMRMDGEPPWSEALTRQRGRVVRWTDYVDGLWRHEGSKHRRKDFPWLAYWYKLMPDSVREVVIERLAQEGRPKMVRDLQALES